MRKLLLLFLSTIVCGHVLAKNVVYQYNLTEVEVVKDGTTHTVKYLSDMAYKDSVISIVWDIDSHALNFSIENNIANSIKIIWDDATFIDTDRNVGKVMHSGIKFINREEHQPETNIPKSGKLDDLLIPIENVYWHDSPVSAVYSRWEQSPLFPIKVKSKEFDSLKQSKLGSVIKVMLPIEMNDKRLEYYFAFTVVNMELQ